MKFVLVRHCETDWNREGRLQGQSDIGLNEKGWLEAEELAKKLESLAITGIISSDLKRSQETSFLLARHLGLEVKLDARLRECNFGSLEGKNREEVLKLYLPRRIDIDGLWHGSFIEYDFEPFGGEPRDRVLRRHLSLLDEFYIESGKEPLLLVGHGTGLGTLLTYLKKPPLHRGEYIVIEYPD